MNLEDRLGRLIEERITSHHRRRLRRVGWERALSAAAQKWPTGEPEPRPANLLEVLIDGEEALAAVAEAIQNARTRVHLTGWHVSPSFALIRDGKRLRLRELLAAAADRGVEVRVLLWAGAPMPLFRPSRADIRRMRDELWSGTRIRCALDPHERPLHCHHEKTVIVDDRVAFVGGIDLTDLDGDRWDTPRHPARAAVGWHDMLARLEGPAVEDVAGHFAMRWQAMTNECLQVERVPPAGATTVQIVRTVPERTYADLPGGDFRILEAYLDALSSAQRFIYIENQFLWSPEILQVLREKLRNPPTDDFRLLLVLPAHPNTGGDDTRGQLGSLLEADHGAGRLLACTLYALGDPVCRVYVHAKLAIVDDRWMTVGSANLNEHSLFNDTEVNVVTDDSALIQKTRHRLWAEHLEASTEAVTGEPTELIDKIWRSIASEQHERHKRKEKPTHRLTLLPDVSSRTALLLGPIQGLLVDA